MPLLPGIEMPVGVPWTETKEYKELIIKHIKDHNRQLIFSKTYKIKPIYSYINNGKQIKIVYDTGGWYSDEYDLDAN